MCYFYWMGILFLSIFLNIGHYNVLGEPNLIGKHGCYKRTGDVNLGVLFPVHSPGYADQLCGERFLGRFGAEASFAIRFAVEKINLDETILPNISLGFLMLDDCAKDTASLARAMAFLPTNKQYLKQVENNNGNYDFNMRELDTDCFNTLNNISVVGIIGPASSRQSIMAASLLSIYEIPMISTSASSDELTDKSRFRYFLRLVPRDGLQAEAMLAFYKAQNWSYSALIYSEGGYGENGAKQIQKEAKKRGICLAFTYMLPSEPEDTDYEYIAKLMKQNFNARVITLFVSPGVLQKLFDTMVEHKILDKFIWFGTESMRSFPEYKYNGFSMTYPSTSNNEFHKALQQWSPSTDPQNPWIFELWEHIYDCSWDTQHPYKQGCGNFDNTSYPYDEFLTKTISHRLIDAVYVYAKALHQLIQENCEDRFSQVDNAILKNCINGKRLLHYMKGVEFDGASGYVRFDSDGDLMGQFLYIQHQDVDDGIQTISVGKWDKLEVESLDIFWDEIRYTKLKGQNNGTDTKQAILSSKETPISVCSQPCGIREQRLEQLLPCCWKCRPCRGNEIVTRNGTECEKCKDKSWPSTDGMKCEPIEADHLQWSDPVVFSLACLSILGFAATIICWALFIRNRKTKLI